MMKRETTYPLIDLFAGPGGLGEGFSNLYNKDGKPSFKSVAAIESDEFSHQTLVLRHFYKLFPQEKVPQEYYHYLAGDITKGKLKSHHKKKWSLAESTALKISLGKNNHGAVKNIIKKQLNGSDKWALIGGPPCQAYSLAGRSRMMANPEFKEDERHFLYKEYLKTIVDSRPPIFIMENVKGLLSAQINGEPTIDKMVKDLSNPIKSLGKNQNGLKYRLYSPSQTGEIKGDVEPASFLVKAEEYGIPQARHRVFILGIRSDLKIEPNTLSKKKPPTVGQIISDMPKIRSGVSRQKDSADLWKRIVTSAQKPTWFPSNNTKNREVKRIIRSAVDQIKKSNLQTSSNRYSAPRTMREWFYDERMKIFTSHDSRSHMESDLHRYLFASSYGAALDISPKLADFPKALLPAHRNIKIGCEGKMFSDRFRVQIKSAVSKTITSHISKDGHYFIHHDPAQCRSLSVREAARLQTFPDNYYFEGPRTSRYHQVGNAVPPYLAFQIAEIVKTILDEIPG